MLGGLFLGLASWILVLALIFGPWAYGSTRPECIQILNSLLFGAASVWVLGRALQRKRPFLPLPLLIFSGAILLMGWGMVGNSHGFIDLTYGQMVPGVPFFPYLPGTLDLEASYQSMLNITAMLLALAMVTDLGRSQNYRLRFVAAMIITGTTLSLFAFWILKTDAKILWWPYGTSPFMFGTFRYHGNAGSFLNLIWPLAAALALTMFLRPNPGWKRISASICFLVLLCAVGVNASKGGQIVAAALCVLALGLLIFSWNRLFAHKISRTLLLAFVAISLVAGGLLVAVGLDRTMQRWDRFSEHMADGNRSQVAAVCLEMIPKAGFFGFGPDTFYLTFPSFKKTLGSNIPWFWRAAHQDYLQTVVEWGYIGTLFWTLLVAGGFFRLGYSLSVQYQTAAATRLLLPTGILLCLTGVFAHALADFPLQVASLRLYTMILLGLAWASPDWIDDKAPIRRRRKIEAPVKTPTNQK